MATVTLFTKLLERKTQNNIKSEFTLDSILFNLIKVLFFILNWSEKSQNFSILCQISIVTPVIM